jgi:hypothetical protein
MQQGLAARAQQAVGAVEFALAFAGEVGELLAQGGAQPGQLVAP